MKYKNQQLKILLSLMIVSFFISSCNIFASLRSGKLKATTSKRSATKSDPENAPAPTQTTTSTSPSPIPTPVALQDAAFTAYNAAKDLSVLTNDTDPDNDAIQIISTTQGAHGTVSIIAGNTSVRYTPDSNYYGYDTFTYTISNSQNGTATATVSIYVRGPEAQEVLSFSSTSITLSASSSLNLCCSVVDSFGNIFLGKNASNIIGANSDTDFIIQKLDSTGAEINTGGWPVHILNPSYGEDSSFTGMAIDTANNIYVIGTVVGRTEWLIKKFNASGVEDTVNWNKQFASNNNFIETSPNAIAIDPSGDVYVVGQGEELVNGTSFVDWWIKKYSSAGVEDTVNWNKRISNGGSTDEKAYGIAFDSSSNVYVSGHGYNLAGGSANRDMWIKKFTSGGTEDTVNWNKRFNGGSNDVQFKVAVNSANEVFVFGRGTNLVGGSSQGDWWLKKFSSTGVEDTLNWNKKFDNNNEDEYTNSVILDDNDNLYVLGTSHNLVNASSNTDIWVKKFSSAGTEDTSNWNKKLDFNSQSEAARFLMFNGTDIFLLGGTSGTSIIKKFSPAGVEDLGWTSLRSAKIWSYKAEAATIDTVGNIYTVGNAIKKYSPKGVEDTTNWNKTIDANVVITDSLNNVYTAKNGVIKKYSPTGIEDTTHWNKNLSVTIRSFAIDANDNLFVVGLGNHLVSGSSFGDWFIKKYSADGVEDTINWDKKISSAGSGNDEAKVIKIAPSGAIFVAGTGYNLVSGTSIFDWWLKKYSSSGIEDTVNWDKKYSSAGPYPDKPYDLTFSPSGEVYLTGNAFNIANGSSSLDTVIKKYSATGIEDTVNWNKIFDYSQETDLTYGESGKAIVVDSSGNVYALGNTRNYFSATSGFDAWIKKFSATGVEDMGV